MKYLSASVDHQFSKMSRMKITWYFCSTEAALDFCENDPCQNGGVCHNRTDDYLCVCPPTFSGENCTDGKINLVVTENM